MAAGMQDGLTACPHMAAVHRFPSEITVSMLPYPLNHSLKPSKHHLVDAVKSCQSHDAHQDRGQIADADDPHLLYLKRNPVPLDLLHQILRVPFPAHVVAHGKASKGKQDVVGDHAHKIKHTVVEDLYLAQDSEGQGAGDPQEKDGGSDDQSSLLPGPL